MTSVLCGPLVKRLVDELLDSVPFPDQDKVLEVPTGDLERLTALLAEHPTRPVRCVIPRFDGEGDADALLCTAVSAHPAHGRRSATLRIDR